MTTAKECDQCTSGTMGDPESHSYDCTAPDRLWPSPSPKDEERASRIARWLDDVDFRNGAVATALDDLDNAVQHARDAGATWEAIGGTLRITRQAAQQRFS